LDAFLITLDLTESHTLSDAAFLIWEITLCAPSSIMCATCPHCTLLLP